MYNNGKRRTYLRHKIEGVVDVKELIALEYLNFEKYEKYLERHDFWELCFVESGEISASYEGEKHALKTGDIMVFAPNGEHAYYSERGNENRVFVVCFECFSQALKPLGGARITAEKQQKDCLALIAEETERTFFMDGDDLLSVVDAPNFGGQQVILIHLEYLLVSLIRRLSDGGGVVFLNEKSFGADLSAVIIRFFEKHIREKLTLDEICAKVNYSRSFLCRTFKAQTGETLFACFNRMKIEEAKRLLKETDLPASHISQTLGFSDEKYFCTLFKKRTGVSPIAYRERALEDTTR